MGDTSTTDDGGTDGAADVTVKDTGTNDTGVTDTGTNDTGTNDTGTNDTGVDDTGTNDTGTDTGVDSGVDTGTDAGVDAGVDAGQDASTTTAQVAAYVWANSPTSASYTPSTSYSYNSAGGAITITRSATGVYSVSFASLTINSGDIQVSAYASTAHCNVGSWGGSAVSVYCYAPNGSAMDSEYTVAVLLNNVTTAANYVAYAWASQPTTASYTASSTYAYNAGGGAITATRSATGTYAMTFTGLTNSGGDVQVSAYNSTANCNIGSWGSNVVNVHCYDNTGAAVDSDYTVSVIANGITSTAKPLAYAWTNQSTSASYTPSTSYSFNSNGQGITATRSAAGTYSITFTNLSVSQGDFKVSAYSSGVLCNVGGWGGNACSVRCYNSSNTLTDTDYTIVYVQ